MTACFSYQGHLLLQLIQVPVFLPLPSIFGATLGGGGKTETEITIHQARRLSSRTFTEAKWVESHARSHIVPSHLHSQTRITTSVRAQWILCTPLHFNLPAPPADHSRDMKRENIFLVEQVPHLLARTKERACVRGPRTVGGEAHHGNHLLLSVSS